VLLQWLRYELGNPDPKAHGITVVNTPTQAQAATIPSGMDAGVLIHPAFLKAQAEIGTVGIVNSFGYTESHYKGTGRRRAPASCSTRSRSPPFYPDGYYLHRSFWIGSSNLVKSQPALVSAFVQAQQDAVAKLSGMDPGPGLRARAQVLGAAARARREVVKGRRAVRARLVLARPKATHRAARDVGSTWSEGKMIPKPLEWKQVRDAFALAAPHGARRLRQDRRKQAGPALINAKDAKDLRGAPRSGKRAVARAQPEHSSPHAPKDAHEDRLQSDSATMGAPWPANLIRKGHALVVSDMQPAAVAALVRSGRHQRPRGPARDRRAIGDRHHDAPDAPDVERVALGPDGIVAGLAKGALYIDMSTIDPATTRKVGAAVVARARTMIDSPVGKTGRRARRRHADADGRRIGGGRRARTAACSTAWAPTSSTAASSARPDDEAHQQPARDRRVGGVDRGARHGHQVGPHARHHALRAAHDHGLEQRRSPSRCPSGRSSATFSPGFMMKLAHKDCRLALQMVEGSA
jgi:hypothetical protein